MSRNPHASNLRHHRQQIIADKREASAKEMHERMMRRYPLTMARLADDD